MRTPVVMDTNVVYVANGQTPQASPSCVIACVDRMERIKQGKERLVLDDQHRILKEYPKPIGQLGPGHAFVKWAWTNRRNTALCELVAIHPHEARGFVEFPEDEDLSAFDPDDRKFVAVALASQDSPPIVNATDTGWRDHQEALARHGVHIDFICPELMEK